MRRHLSADGPASRYDIAWWSGLGLRVIDAALTRLADETTAQHGPDGRVYLDLAGAPRLGEAPTLRLLPEFDALWCAYHPTARQRFVSPNHYRQLWFPQNGSMLAPLLCDGRLTGYWKFAGAGIKRSCEVSWFTGTRCPLASEIDGPVKALEAAYGITVTRVTITRAS